MNKDISTLLDLSDKLHDNISVMSLSVFGAAEFITSETGEKLGFAHGLNSAFRGLEAAVDEFQETALNIVRGGNNNVSDK